MLSESHRRNVITRGIDPGSLIGKNLRTIIRMLEKFDLCQIVDQRLCVSRKMQSTDIDGKASAGIAKTENPATLRVVYACSGCSDAGELADRIARALHQRGIAEMSCLAGIGGRVKHLVKKAALAEQILVIDGCPISCGKHTLELARFEHFSHLQLQDLGLRKGECPVTAARIEQGVGAAVRVLKSKIVRDVPSEKKGL
jgi:uncharacterized metal-binding protein